MSCLALLGGRPVVPPCHPLARLHLDYPLAAAFADYVGARFALPTSNGTSALVSALLGGGVGPGDEVITVAHTWFSTATAVLQVNAVPIFVDVEPTTFTMDPNRIQERMSERTRAILAVSLYGHPADYDRILGIGRRHGITVIDDACQSTGAALNGRKLGSVADITAFSFSGKPLISTGGGMVTTDDAAFYERSMLGGQHPSFISTHARGHDTWVLASTGGFGHNFRIDGKCAERAYEQLERLDAINDARRSNAAYLSRLLSDFDGIQPPLEREGAYHIYHMYTGLFDEARHGITRNEFVAALNAEGLPVLSYTSGVNFLKTPVGQAFWAGPLHRRHLFRELDRTGQCGPFRLPSGCQPEYGRELPVTEEACAREFNIPQRWMNPPFGRQRMEQYAEAIAKVLKNSDAIRAVRSTGLRQPHYFLLAGESDR